ncbi:MAG: serine O-acetyltransferase [Myxococcales bacterium]|nr:serine acetyltransferase [Myxococcales bacterium]HZX63964.1 serine acetyltransferase [Myxococcales bacterium]
MTRGLPSPVALRTIADALRSALFPAHFGEADLPGALADLEDQVRRTSHGEESRVVRAFAERLPRIRMLLSDDAQAAYEGDPAAVSIDEVLLCYPGFTAITYHRIAHELHVLGVTLLPRMLAALGQSLTAVDIHPAARIGGRFFIDHGTGVVIGETAVIGERVRIYQGVTLGAKSFALDERGRPIKGIARHPVLEDDVIVYSGATLLGRITIGKGSIIGGNVWLTRSVPPGSRMTQAQPQREAFEDGGGI